MLAAYAPESHSPGQYRSQGSKNKSLLCVRKLYKQYTQRDAVMYLVEQEHPWSQRYDDKH